MDTKFHSLCDVVVSSQSSKLPADNRTIKNTEDNYEKHSQSQQDISFQEQPPRIIINEQEIMREAISKMPSNLRKQQQQINDEQRLYQIEKTRKISKKEKKLSELGPEIRPHFRIDWRQLSFSRTEKSWQSRWQFQTRSNKQGIAADKSSKTKRILNSLDGHFRSGQLSAILGPSGAGKSTFLSTLFGSRQESASGETRLTWLANQSSSSTTSTTTKNEDNRPLRVAFLPQQDHLLHHLTVYETLLFASRLKNQRKQGRISANGNGSGKSVDDESRFHAANVRRVARMLKLTDCLNTRCGKLSGGQYKRVSIGQELLSQPDVIILDEPTSGLDASTCLSTVRTLKNIVSGQPISIILTIHQPDSDVFQIFDWVYVIAQGGLAIYEGPPSEIIPTLKQVGLEPPRDHYNAARFIVENAFIFEQTNEADDKIKPESKNICDNQIDDSIYVSSSSSSSEDEEDGYNEEREKNRKRLGSKLTQSLISIKDTIIGREIGPVGGDPKKARSRPLLNIGGFKTLGGELIKVEKLRLTTASNKHDEDDYSDDESGPEVKEKVDLTRLTMLQRLNEIQRQRYYTTTQTTTDDKIQSDEASKNGLILSFQTDQSKKPSRSSSSHLDSHLDSKSDYSSAASSSSASEPDNTNDIDRAITPISSQNVFTSPSEMNETNDNMKEHTTIQLPTTINEHQNQSANCSTSARTSYSLCSDSTQPNDQFFRNRTPTSGRTSSNNNSSSSNKKHGCNFDKRLSATNNHHQKPALWYQARLLAHRTWLSIVRDPIFFGIQAFMHTTIPVLLALIFGSRQQEGCPHVGSFDLVQFAYATSSMNSTIGNHTGFDDSPKSIISDAVISIRQSVGNVGIIFFEMFVLSFSINCITALVFPSDMFVLLKEYRNGWYSMSSYFIGRSIADLPIPVVLHSLAIIILCHLTKQPIELWRLSSIIFMVILGSLIAQSVGLTVGAILMKNSQSAVLAAAGIVAPFFALSGFIVRIHTLPPMAQLFAQGSYLHQLLNGFIILRYGFHRCPCKEEDFVENPSHRIPAQLHTMASIWIGTFNQEYANMTTTTNTTSGLNGTELVATGSENEDPNIDVVGKIMSSFKSANSFGHQMNSCKDVRPYAMLDFNLHDSDIYGCFMTIIAMVVITRIITFGAIYYKVKGST